MEWQRTDREIATGTYEYLSKATNESGSLSENGFRLIIEEIKELAKVSREVALSEVADLSILREAQKELGIKRTQFFILYGLCLKTSRQGCLTIGLRRPRRICASHPRR